MYQKLTEILATMGITAQCVDGENNLGLDLAEIWRPGNFYVHGLRVEIDLTNETSE